MKVVFGILFIVIGVAAIIYGFAVTAPPVGTVLNQIGAEMAMAYSMYRAEHPIATGVGLIIAGSSFLAAGGAILQKRIGGPKPSTSSP